MFAAVGLMLALGAIQDGPDIQPPKAINVFLVRGEHLTLCPSSSNLCMACYKHARLTGCTDCDYLVDAERLSDGSIRCTWATLPFLKTQR